jgi:hypothetical protein
VQGEAHWRQLCRWNAQQCRDRLFQRQELLQSRATSQLGARRCTIARDTTSSCAVVATSRATVGYRAQRCAAWCATLQHAAQRYNYRAQEATTARDRIPTRRPSVPARTAPAPRRGAPCRPSGTTSPTTPRGAPPRARPSPVNVAVGRRVLAPRRRRHVRQRVSRVARATWHAWRAMLRGDLSARAVCT